MATLKELESALIKADAAGNVDDARALTRAIDQMRTAPAPAPAITPAPAKPEARPSSSYRPSFGSLAMGEQMSIVPENKQEAMEYSAGASAGMKKAAPAMVRYGVPITAGALAAPLTGGASVPASIAIMSGVGAASSGASEIGAQLLEGRGRSNDLSGLVTGQESKPIDWREVASATALGATPFAPARAGISPLATAGRAAFNVGSAIGTTELARIARGEEFDASRWIAPVAFSGAFTALNEAGGVLAALGDKSRKIQAERFGGGVTLTDIVPELSRLEAQRVQRGSATARKALESMDANVGDELVKAFPDVPDMAQKVTNELAPLVGRISELKNNSKAAVSSYEQAKQAADDAVRFGRPERVQLLKEAQTKALEAVKQQVIEKQAINQFFGGIAPDLESVSSGSQQRLLGQIADTVKTARREGLGRLYDQAGIGLNDPVVTIQNVTQRLQAMAGQKGNVMQGNEARARAIDVITRAFSESPDQSTLTREGLMDLKDRIATSLNSVPGADVRRAERQASELYNVVKEASNDYIAATFPERAQAYAQANEAAARMFRAGDSDLVNAVRNQSPTEIVSRIRQEGVGKSLKEIDDYVGALENLGPEYAPVAAEFRQGVNNVVRAGLIKEAAEEGTGWAGNARVIDFPVLAKKVEALAEKGYPIQGLGFGTRDEIRHLARVSSALGKGGITLDEVQQFVQQSPVIGAQAASARIAYNRALREQIVNGALGKKSANAARLRSLEKQAKLSAADAERALQDAQNDPVARLLNETALNLKRDPVQNSEWVSSIVTMPSSTVRDFVKAMETSAIPGRQQLLDQIRISATANVMRDLLEVPSLAGKQNFNPKQFRQLFTGMDPASVEQRQALRALIGDPAYDNLTRRFVMPMARILDTKAKLGIRDPQNYDFLRGALAAQGIAQNQSTSGLIKALAYVATIRGAEQPAYYTFYKLFADPKTAPKFARLGYSMEKATQQPELAGILKVAQMQDRMAADERAGAE